jgi:putative DNA primase/helicase
MSTTIGREHGSLRVEIGLNGNRKQRVAVRHTNGSLLDGDELVFQDAGQRDRWKARVTGLYPAAGASLDILVTPLLDDVFKELNRVKPETEKESPEPELWPDAVDGAEALNAIVVALRRFVILAGVECYAAVALWVLFAHAHDAFRFSPLLLATSAERSSGKSRLLEILSVLTPRAWLMTSPSDAVVYRKIDAQHPTFLLDEGDNVDWKERRELLSIFNAGYQRRSAFVPRMIGEGSGMDFYDFSVWCPKALACIKVPLPDTTVSRSVVLKLKRKARTERVEELRDRTAVEVFHPLRAMAARWAKDCLEDLRQAEPSAPGELSDRSKDAWEPLFAVADMAGGDWPARARSAALFLAGAMDGEESTGAELLADLRQLFADRGVSGISTKDIVAVLNDNEERGWGGWNKGSGLNGRNLASLLRPFGVAPHNVRDGDRQFKGYGITDFKDAWERYLPDTPEISVPSVPALQDNDLLRPKENGLGRHNSLVDKGGTDGTAEIGVGRELFDHERGDAWEGPADEAA